MEKLAATSAILSPPPLPETDRPVPAIPQIQESKGKPSYFLSLPAVVIAGGVLLFLAIILTSSITKETYEQSQKESESRHVAEKKAIIHTADETVRNAKKAEAEAVERAQKMETDRAAEKHEHQVERDNLKRQLDLVVAELSKIKQQAVSERQQAEKQKADEEGKRKEALLRAETEKKNAMSKFQKSITSTDAQRMNQATMAAAGRGYVTLTSMLTPEVIRFGQAGQMVIRITNLRYLTSHANANIPQKLGDLNLKRTGGGIGDSRRNPQGEGTVEDHTIIYSISPEKPGRYELPAFEVDVDGLILYTSLFQLNVLP